MDELDREASFLFNVIDEDGSNSLAIHEFFSLVSVAKVKISTERPIDSSIVSRGVDLLTKMLPLYMIPASVSSCIEAYYRSAIPRWRSRLTGRAEPPRWLSLAPKLHRLRIWQLSLPRGRMPTCCGWRANWMMPFCICA